MPNSQTAAGTGTADTVVVAQSTSVYLVPGSNSKVKDCAIHSPCVLVISDEAVAPMTVQSPESRPKEAYQVSPVTKLGSKTADDPGSAK